MKALLVTVLVLLLLLVGADYVGRAVAESKAGEAIATRAHLSTAPRVDIHGFSFLVQALPGHYSDIAVSSSALTLGPVTGVRATADLTAVDFPLSDALAGNTDHLTAGHATLRAVLPVASIAAALKQDKVTLSAGPGGSLQLSTVVTVAGAAVPVTADVTATYAGGTLTLTAGHVTAAGLSGALADTLARSLSLAVPLGNLPIAVSTATVHTEGTDLVIDAAADHVTASQLR